MYGDSGSAGAGACLRKPLGHRSVLGLAEEQGQAAALAAPLDQTGSRLGSKDCALQAARAGLPDSLLLCALPLPCCLGVGDFL